MMGFLQRQWFLTVLVALMAVGTGLGMSGHAPAAQAWLKYVDPKVTTAFILFLMAFSLETRMLWAALRSPGPVALGFVINAGVLPLIAWPLCALQLTADFRYGLMVAAAVPSTQAAAAVMTRRAGGNDAVSLLITMTTNMACWMVIPFWLGLATGTAVEINRTTLMLDLLYAVLLPTLLAQLARQPRRIQTWATKHKQKISNSAQLLILVIVFIAALKAGDALHKHAPGAAPTVSQISTPAGAVAPDEISIPAVGLVWLCCIGLHLFGLIAGLRAGRLLGMSTTDSDAVGFAGSQKTLPIGLYLATTVFANHHFALLPMLLFHASQLFIDTLVSARLADSQAAKG